MNHSNCGPLYLHTVQSLQVSPESTTIPRDVLDSLSGFASSNDPINRTYAPLTHVSVARVFLIRTILHNLPTWPNLNDQSSPAPSFPGNSLGRNQLLQCSMTWTSLIQGPLFRAHLPLRLLHTDLACGLEFAGWSDFGTFGCVIEQARGAESWWAVPTPAPTPGF